MNQDPNYEEAKAGNLPLPPLLERPQGGLVTTATEWNNIRRREIRSDFVRLMYGELPPRLETIRFELRRERSGTLDGAALRREVRIHLGNRGREHFIDALWYLPTRNAGKVPAIVGLNFKGNHACSHEPDLLLPDPAHARGPVAARGEQEHRWCFKSLVENGFSVITAAREDLFPDRADGRAESIWRLFHHEAELTPANRDLTAISAWSYGITLLVDLLLSDPAIDGTNIWVHGHSRLGKTALWAAANDLRLAGAISNDSGCCGAAPSRRNFGETLETITRAFPWWFTERLDAYAGREAELPFDQHHLLALVAPRPVLVASATEDLWADPRGEFLSARAAGEVYRLFGSNGIGDAEFPPPDQPVFGDAVGYYRRTGKHDVTPADWEFVMRFIRRNSMWK